MAEIPIGVTGKITAGKEQGQFVKVQADDGGYLILVSIKSDFSVDGYDYWIMEEELPGFFEEAHWEVDWTL